MAIQPHDDAWRDQVEQCCNSLEAHREIFERAARTLERVLGYDLDELGFSALDEFDAIALIDAIREREAEIDMQQGQ